MDPGRITFNTAKGPRPAGPYSSAVVCGEMAWLSGLIAIDPENGKPVTGETIEAEAHRVFQNAGIILKELGCDYGEVLKVTLYLTDMADFSAVNGIYAHYFGPDYPARTAVQVAALPLGMRLEADLVAHIP